MLFGANDAFDPSVFGPDPPHGEPGIHLLRWAGEGFERLARLPLSGYRKSTVELPFRRLLEFVNA